MEERKVKNRRHKSSQSRIWIPLVIVGFVCFCVIQALSIYLRLGMETKRQQVVEDKDALKHHRDTVKQKVQYISNHTSEGWVYFGEHLYLVSDKKQNWNESRNFCQERGADLIIIDSIEEQEFMDLKFSGTKWIGLSDLEEEGQWKWVDGSQLNTSFWEEGEPNDNIGAEDCGTVYFDSNLNNWNDYYCTEKLNCICEKSLI